MSEKVLYDHSPAMFKADPAAFILCVILIPVVIGAVILLVWWLRAISVRLTVTDQRITLREGLLSKHINELYHGDVRNIRISQSLMNRIFDTGTVGISSAGQGDVEITVSGIPTPSRVRDIIDRHRREAQEPRRTE